MRGYMKASDCKKRLRGEVFLRKFVFSRVTAAVSKNLELETSCVLNLHIQVSSHLRSSHLTSSHPHDICASSHLRSSHLRFSYRRIFQYQQIIASQIFVSSRPQHLQIHISDLHISYIVTSAAHLRIFISQLLQSSLRLHIFGSSSPSYLIIFKISVCRFYTLIYLRLQNLMPLNTFPSLSGQPSSSFVFSFFLSFFFSLYLFLTFSLSLFLSFSLCLSFSLSLPFFPNA